MTATSEKIWRGDPRGLREALLNAKELEGQGNLLDAAVMRASAFYSYVHGVLALHRLYRARFYAEEAAALFAEKVRKEGEAKVSHGQCDVIGTILLRRVLWKKPNPSEALKFFVTGLNKSGMPFHSRALLYMGKAEAMHLMGSLDQADMFLHEAVWLEEEVLAERNLTFARRQFLRVLRRAFVLAHHIGRFDLAHDLYAQAKTYAAKEPDIAVATRAMERVQREWDKVLFPNPVTRLFYGYSGRD